MDTKRILLIEDEAEDILLFRTQFELVGYQVIDARTPEEGLKKAADQHPDIIILDLVLGDRMQLKGGEEFGGIKLLTQISADPALKNIPVVVLTNLDKEAYAAKVKSAGAKEFLSKAELLPEEIVAHIKNLIG